MLMRTPGLRFARRSHALAVAATSCACIIGIIAAAAPTSAAPPLPTLELPHSSLVPGGVFVAPIDGTANRIPVVTYDGKRAMVLRSDNHWVAVVGLPLAITPGHASIRVQAGDAPEVP